MSFYLVAKFLLLLLLLPSVASSTYSLSLSLSLFLIKISAFVHLYPIYYCWQCIYVTIFRLLFHCLSSSVAIHTHMQKENYTWMCMRVCVCMPTYNMFIVCYWYVIWFLYLVNILLCVRVCVLLFFLISFHSLVLPMICHLDRLLNVTLKEDITNYNWWFDDTIFPAIPQFNYRIRYQLVI